MLQTSPTDSLLRAFDPAPHPFGEPADARGTFAAGGWPALGGTPVPAANDGVTTPWFRPATPVDPPLPGGWGGSAGPGWSAGGQGGAILGLISGLLGAVQQLVSSLFGGNGAGAGQFPGGPQGGGQRFFRDADLSSTGDPHLALVGTRCGPGGNAQVNEHFDSMTSHRDLFDSRDVAGGYRVSTAVSEPDANGVTTNRSATVHAGFGRDTVTVHADGSFSVLDGGEPRALAKGQSATLSGGEIVRANDDGSLTVSATAANGGSVATTLRAVAGRVDVTAHAHGIDLGGDLVNHGAPAP
jgi:hypothetical protein